MTPLLEVLDAAKKILGYSLRGGMIFLVSTFLFSMFLGFFIMLISPGGSGFSQNSLESLPLGLLVLFVVRVPVRTTYGIAFIFLWATYLICFAIVWRTNGGFVNALKFGTPGPVISARCNFLFLYPALSSSLLVLVVLIQGFQEASGVPTGSIEFKDTYRGLFELTYSPLFEELMFRISPFVLYWAVRLGLLFARRGIRDPIVYSRALLSSIAFPDRAKENLGLVNVRTLGIRRGIALGEWVLILLTSMIFGLAHYLSGSGWEIGKISSSFVAGLAFSMAYLTFGFPAPILLHWFFNYYFYVYEVAAQNYHFLFKFLGDIIEYTVQIVGGAVLVILSIPVLRRITGKFAAAANLETNT